MISFLSSVLIPGRENVTDPVVRQKYGVLCGAVGICLNLLLFAGKFFAGTVANSIAITADAINNLSDVGSSLITLIGFKLAGQTPDLNHPFGHGRIEYVSGLIVSFLIILMGVGLLKSSVEKILHPEAVDGSPLVIAILVVSICVKVYMYLYNRSIGKKIDSAAMKATALDSLSDTVATLAVLGTTLIAQCTSVMIDGWCGILVAFFILYSGVSAAKDTISPLLGQRPEEAFVGQIEQIVMAHPEVQGMHDLIVHNYGPGRVMISLHAEVPAHGDILMLHDAIDNIECELKERLKCDAVIHMDPIVTDDPAVNALKEKVMAQVQAIDPALSIHDFRVVAGPTHTNVIFDLELPYHFYLKEETVVQQLKDFISELEGHRYFAVIQVDHSYVGGAHKAPEKQEST
ncbi:MAG: cation diffusion facilitator family transporter [Clostridiales bacterium]|nr:cation diffusion facilitator family transporter [Clostridiales bacterium]MDY4036425.1 cation diffusion facilitator family transporter [Candidatus Pseudoscilispira sp.]